MLYNVLQCVKGKQLKKTGGASICSNKFLHFAIIRLQQPIFSDPNFLPDRITGNVDNTSLTQNAF